MNALSTSGFFIALLGLLIVQIDIGASPTSGASDGDITCKEAQQNAGKVKEGMRESEVIDLIGKPDSIEKGIWAYSFWECRPPIKPGMQIIIGIALTFEDKAVTKIDYATMCATGPGH